MPVGWITSAEIYFEVQNTVEDVRIKLAMLSMEGSTIHWFNLLRETEELVTQDKFKKALVAKFGGRRTGNPFERVNLDKMVLWRNTLRPLNWLRLKYNDYQKNNIQGIPFVDFNRRLCVGFIFFIPNSAFKPCNWLETEEKLTESHIYSNKYRGQNNNWQQDGAVRLAKSVISSGWETNTRGASSKS